MPPNPSLTDQGLTAPSTGTRSDTEEPTTPFDKQESIRGTQYTSEQIAQACSDLPVLRSMGRTGVCWDNAAAESFWSTLKTEFYNRRHWPTKAEAKQAVGA